jgi:hypothetical protein
MRNGFFTKEKRVPIDSRKLFRVFRLLITEMLSPRQIAGLGRIISNEWPAATNLASFCVPDGPGFDELSTLDRLVIMGITEWDVHGISLGFFKKRGSYPFILGITHRYWKMRQEDVSGWTRLNLAKFRKS